MPLMQDIRLPKSVPSSAIELGRKTVSLEMQALASLIDGLDEAFWQCAHLISECTGLVWITAVGTSASVGTRFAHILTCCGIRSMFLSPSDGLHGHAGVIQAEDILIAMSRGGESQEVAQMVTIANERGAKTIAFVHNIDSTLAQACQYILPIQSRQEYELMGYLATTSSLVFSATCDALCAVVIQVKGYTPEEFAKIHPGGAVGKALLELNGNS
jgi:D-arabinose 5-phosphate isomerase GutQ